MNDKLCICGDAFVQLYNKKGEKVFDKETCLPICKICGLPKRLFYDKNFANCALDIAVDSDVFDGGNFSQDTPETVISTAKNLTFRGGNLTRGKIDPVLNWIIDDCNTCPFPKEPEIVVDPVDTEIEQAVNKLAELSFQYPDKVSAKLKSKVDKETTEGLLSADGNPVIIEAPGGWKK